MTKYYAYKVDENGKEPTGTTNRLLFELKTDRGAVLRAFRILDSLWYTLHIGNCALY
jgi:hypothetical protein